MTNLIKKLREEVKNLIKKNEDYTMVIGSLKDDLEKQEAKFAKAMSFHKEILIVINSALGIDDEKKDSDTWSPRRWDTEKKELTGSEIANLLFKRLLELAQGYHRRDQETKIGGECSRALMDVIRISLKDEKRINEVKDEAEMVKAGMMKIYDMDGKTYHFENRESYEDRMGRKSRRDMMM